MDLDCARLGLQETMLLVCAVFPSVVGRPDQSATVGLDFKDYYIGDELQTKLII